MNMSERPLRTIPPTSLAGRSGVAVVLLIVLAALTAAVLIITHARPLGPVHVNLHGLSRELMRRAFPDRSIPGPDRRARPPIPSAHPTPSAAEPGG
jgi:hypothetical protein